jgi:hypothetical protein
VFFDYLHSLSLLIMTSPTANVSALEVRTKDGVKFGRELREKEFLFQKGFVNLNHGERASYSLSFQTFNNWAYARLFSFNWFPYDSPSQHYHQSTRFPIKIMS